MPPDRFPIPQGTLDMLVLQLLSLGAAHGYAIAQRIEQISRSVVQVNQGSLYPALHRLELKKWLRSEWRASETGREAKFYSMTRAGEKQLAIEKESWDKLAAAVRLIFAAGGERGMGRLPNLFGRGPARNERDLDRELRYHFDRRVEDLRAAGLGEDESRRRAAI